MNTFSLNFLQSELNRVSEWIQFSDKKTAFLSAFYSAIFGLVFSQKESILQHFIIYQKWITCFYAFILVGFIIAFVVGIVFLFKSVFPRLKNLFTDKSLFYFGHVANMKFIDYSEEIKKLTEDEAKKQIIEQIYTNSIIANQKMKNVQKSIESFVALIIFTILLILL
jgi:hypothetical protein